MLPLVSTLGISAEALVVLMTGSSHWDPTRDEVAKLIIRWRYVSDVDVLPATGKWSRREFVQAAITFAAAIAFGRAAHAAPNARAAETPSMTSPANVTLRVNGRDLPLQ